jgi:hypothetical protein
VIVRTEGDRRSALADSHVAALQDSAVLLPGFLFDAISDLRRGVPFEATWLAEFLPKRYAHEYDEHIARKFLTCVLTVAAQLWSSESYRPACVGEHLAFCALLDFAQATLEERGVDPNFGPDWEAAFDDLGVKTLFDDSHAVEPRLELSEWFRPIGEQQPHPSIRFQDRVRTRIS